MARSIHSGADFVPCTEAGTGASTADRDLPRGRGWASGSSIEIRQAELEAHNLCAHLPVKLLSRGAVGEYIAARFVTQAVSDRVVATIYRRSEGNPLLMVKVTDYLMAQHTIMRENGLVELSQAGAKEETPATIHELVDGQITALASEDQLLLEVASVAGMSFSAAAVAAGLKKPVEEVETRCERLVEHEQFLQPSGITRWPDGTIASRYSFIHTLYQNVIYDRVGDSRRARLHQTIGESIEAAY
jgi:predicted ATPase